MKTAADLINEAKRRIREVSVDEAMQLHQRGEGVVFLDVRDQPEVNLARIPGAVHLSRGTMEGKVEAVVPRDAQVIVYCASGNRSALAADVLQEMGYGDVRSMAGGIKEWSARGGAVE